jgi:RNA polymerase sigma-70 factor (ECF subfamily)
VADTTVGFHFDYPQSAHSADDRNLAEALRAGEETAYETLIQRFEQPVFGIVSRLTDDPADSADVVQEVFLKVFRNIGSFRGESSLKTWIYRIAVNEARNHRRWFGRHRGKEVGLEPAPADEFNHGDWLPADAPDPYEITLDHEVQGLMEQAFERISPSYRAALVLREVEELSYEEIAEVLEISVGTVKSRILRGRESLRKQLASLLEPEQPAEWTLAHGLGTGKLGGGRNTL